MYVNFGEPFSCREMMEAEGAFEVPNEDPAHGYFIRKLAYTVLQGINRVALLTPSAITAMALLIHPKRGVRRETLLARAGYILEMGNRKNAPLSKTLQHALKVHRQDVAAALAELAALEEGSAGLGVGARDRALALGEDSPLARAHGQAVVEAIDEALARFVDQKQVERHEFEDGVVYTPVPHKRVNLDYYKNNIVHLFVPEALLSAALKAALDHDRAPLEEVRQGARFLAEMLKHEFVYAPDQTFDQQFNATLERLVAIGLVERDGEDSLAIPRAAEQTVVLLHHVLEPWLEAYWTMAVTLHDQLREPTPLKDFVKQVQKVATRRYHEGDIRCPESANAVTLNHAIEIFKERELVRVTRKGRETLLSLASGSAEDPGRLPALARRLHHYFAATYT
jgi:glycerol-3-phosphate O-acyltransferase